MTKIFHLFGAVFLTTACQPELADETSITWDELVQQAFAESSSIRDYEGIKSLIPYQSIGFERGSCYGDCPVYKMVIHLDSTAELITDHLYPDKAVTYAGHVYIKDYMRLAQLVERAKAAADKPGYSGRWTDDYTAKIAANGSKGEWAVFDYGRVAPPEIWALEQILHQFRMSTEWERVNP